MGAEPIYAVAAFAIVNSIYHVSYLVAVFSVSVFSLARLWLVLTQGVFILVLSAALMALVRFMAAGVSRRVCLRAAPSCGSNDPGAPGHEARR